MRKYNNTGLTTLTGKNFFTNNFFFVRLEYFPKQPLKKLLLYLIDRKLYGLEIFNRRKKYITKFLVRFILTHNYFV